MGMVCVFRRASDDDRYPLLRHPERIISYLHGDEPDAPPPVVAEAARRRSGMIIYLG